MRIFLSIILWVVMLVAPVRADSVTLTTYYPSPSGDYANLHVSGNVGVGTSAPSQKLDVNGNIHATGDICTEAGGGKCLSTVAGISEIVTVNEAACGNTDFTLTASCAPGYKLLSCAGGSMAGLMIDFGFFKVSGFNRGLLDVLGVNAF